MGINPESDPAKNTLVLSTVLPKDSLGEAVYTYRGKDNPQATAVPGVFVGPELIKRVDAKYPKSLRKAKADAVVVVRGVISRDGRLIDAVADATNVPEAAENAVKAVSQYQFRPATLDGTSIAIQIRIQVSFRMR